MRAQHLLRLDTLVLIIMARKGEDTSIPEVMTELDIVLVQADTSSVHRSVARLLQEGLLTCTGHDLKHGQYLVRVYTASVRGKQEAAHRVERLAGVLGLATPAYAGGI